MVSSRKCYKCINNRSYHSSNRDVGDGTTGSNKGVRTWTLPQWWARRDRPWHAAMVQLLTFPLMVVDAPAGAISLPLQKYEQYV